MHAATSIVVAGRQHVAARGLTAAANTAISATGIVHWQPSAQQQRANKMTASHKMAMQLIKVITEMGNAAAVKSTYSSSSPPTNAFSLSSSSCNCGM